MCRNLALKDFPLQCGHITVGTNQDNRAIFEPKCTEWRAHPSPGPSLHDEKSYE